MIYITTISTNIQTAASPKINKKYYEINQRLNHGLLIMSDVNEWTELGNSIRYFLIWTISSIVDSAFLALWVIIQWLVNNKVVAILLIFEKSKSINLASQF